MGRFLLLLMALAAPALADPPASRGYSPLSESWTMADLPAWLDAFHTRALAAGITEATWARARPAMVAREDVLERDRNQAEFSRTIWDYLDRAVSEDRVARGQEAMKTHAATLARIEAAYHVDPAVVVAIWGLESDYGANRGDVPVLAGLATLASSTRRAAYFESELVAALRLVQDGADPGLKGSWAGALGHTQFMPSNVLGLAVDFDGDGQRALWADDPTDALASTAAFLAHWGWGEGPWGVEVTLPRDIDWSLVGERIKKPGADWAALGVEPVSETLPDCQASLLAPAGHRGAAFLICPNFHAIEAYNPADAYVIAVGHLSDRIKGAAPLQHDWPRDLRALTLAERIALQQGLTRAGFDTKGADGKIGPNTQAAIRAFQKAKGLIPDGYASPDLLPLLP
ncbi:lytic murein transglycosylase [Stagnihabitans tardus]|uniref:Lytic murein transglycosylase n=1 Tax=Stagnihabitans tardus TaxID=2699202 RepID=A0AAE4Y642_9RHOB|nr:lytic murein transglycosylase [Stagnihabitans tardus]NBZ86502.1 lytic murein transglycosylase [Stagnihabitans tardus]